MGPRPDGPAGPPGRAAAGLLLALLAAGLAGAGGEGRGSGAVAPAAAGAGAGAGAAYGVEQYVVLSPGHLDRAVKSVVRRGVQQQRARGVEPGKGTNPFSKGGYLYHDALAFSVKAGFVGPEQGEVLEMLGPGGDDGEEGEGGGNAAAPGQLDAAEAGGSSGAVALEGFGAAGLPLGEELAGGAVASAGAFALDGAAEEEALLRPADVVWRAAANELEDTAAASNCSAELAAAREDMVAWFEAGGGRLDGVAYLPPAGVRCGDEGAVEALRDLGAGAAIVRVPIKLTISQVSMRSTRNKGGYVGQQLEKGFKHNEQWALAAALLHEYNKETYGEGSRWGPYVRSLSMLRLGSLILRELEGTYAGDLQQGWEKDVEHAYEWLTTHTCGGSTYAVCLRDSEKMSSGKWTREDLQWALYVVKRYAVRVRRQTNAKPFLALVPLVGSLPHRAEAAGDLSLGFDNVVTLHSAAFGEGEKVHLSRGNLSDAQTFLTFHSIAPEVNPHNRVRIGITGAGLSGEDHLSQIKILAQWRRELNLPPRSSDLWRHANALQLYGDEEEEQQFFSQGGIRLGVGTDTNIHEEEKLMLTGQAASAEQAAAMVPGGLVHLKASQDRAPVRIYSVPDIDDDPHMLLASRKLLEMAQQFEDAARGREALDHAAARRLSAVLNDTQSFYLNGSLPKRGMDDIDEMLVGKMKLMDACGAPDDFVVGTAGVTEELLCAARVNLMNETEYDLLEPGFNASEAVSLHNENRTLHTIERGIRAMLGRYPTAVEDDYRILDELHEGGASELLITAVILRIREKALLQEAVEGVGARLADLEANATAGPTQVDRLHRRKVAQEEVARAWERRANATQAAARAPKLLVNIPVNLGGGAGGSRNFSLYSNESVDAAVAGFAAAHSLTPESAATLKRVAAEGIPTVAFDLFFSVVLPSGHNTAFTVLRGGNLTEGVLDFCALHGLPQTSVPNVQAIAAKRWQMREGKEVLLEVPVEAPPSGQKHLLEVRQGEQHDLVSHVSGFALSAKISQEFVGGLVKEVEARLPALRVKIPVNLGQEGKRLALRISAADHAPLLVVDAFCEKNEISEPTCAEVKGGVSRVLAPPGSVSL